MLQLSRGRRGAGRIFFCNNVVGLIKEIASTTSPDSSGYQGPWAPLFHVHGAGASEPKPAAGKVGEEGRERKATLGWGQQVMEK